MTPILPRGGILVTRSGSNAARIGLFIGEEAAARGTSRKDKTMGKIIVITVRQRDPRSGIIDEIISHGIDAITERHIPLPGDRPADIGATFCNDRGEWIIDPARMSASPQGYAI